jgi:hypothetical protein
MRIAQGYYLMVYAAIVMVMMAFCPSGILGLIERARRMVSRDGRLAAAAGAEAAKP